MASLKGKQFPNISHKMTNEHVVMFTFFWMGNTAHMFCTKEAIGGREVRDYITTRTNTPQAAEEAQFWVEQKPSEGAEQKPAEVAQDLVSNEELASPF